MYHKKETYISPEFQIPFLSFKSVKSLSVFRSVICCLLFLTAALCSTAQDIPPRPQPPQLVNDYTRTLMPSQVEALEHKLVAYADSTSTQIAIVIVPTIGKSSMVQYAVKLGREWGVGGKKFNNGVIILIAKNDHKAFIATGYGMEGPLPDATANEIVDQDIIPNFRQEDYYEGLEQATSDIIAAAAGEYKAPPKSAQRGGSGWIFFIIFILIILFIIFLSSRGGGGGKGGSTTYHRRGYGMGPFLGGALLGGMLGGGFRGGGGFGGGGGGFGGGGFGGFGGGGFGGGGAGGGW